jgi:hypothetical protein
VPHPVVGYAPTSPQVILSVGEVYRVEQGMAGFVGGPVDLPWSAEQVVNCVG